MKAYCACIYGLGGAQLDPPGGMATLQQKIAALGVDVNPGGPWDQANIEAVAGYLKTLPAAVALFIVGDSCGANKAPWAAAAIAPRKVAYIACIQASIYCQQNCPDIPPNVGEALVIYSDYVHTGGLGCYIPRPADGNTATRYRQSFVPAFHPDDQDAANVQEPILADIKRILATVAA